MTLTELIIATTIAAALIGIAECIKAKREREYARYLAHAAAEARDPANHLYERDGKVYDGNGVEHPDFFAWGGRTLYVADGTKAFDFHAADNEGESYE